MKAAQLGAHVQARLGWAPSGPALPLEGGLLNVVWRQPTRAGPVIAKWAPPHVASAPEVPLDPARLAFEAWGLSLFGPGRQLASLGAGLRPPRLLDYDASAHVVLLEDLGDLPDLGRWLVHATDSAAAQLGERLGRFLGQLHGTTWRDPALGELDNAAIQRTRLAVQYEAVAALLDEAGVPDAEALGARARELGQRLCQPGHCLVQGDLWPASLLIAEPGPGPDGAPAPQAHLIDWELCHFGRPGQDVGHLRAHLWLLEGEGVAVAAPLEAGFSAAYAERVPAELWDADARRDAQLHEGCEVLARSLGAFARDPYREGPRREAALARALELLRRA